MKKFNILESLCSPLTLLFLTRASKMGNCVDQFEAPEEVDRARLNCLRRWTETRLDTVVITVPGKHGDLYRLLCETSVFFFIPAPVCFPLTDESQLIKPED